MWNSNIYIYSDFKTFGENFYLSVTNSKLFFLEILCERELQVWKIKEKGNKEIEE